MRHVPGLQAEQGEGGVMHAVLPDEVEAQHGDDCREGCPGQQAEDDELVAQLGLHLIDQDIDAYMNAGSNAVGGAEFCHPDEHDDAQFLGPAEVEAEQPVLHSGNGYPGGVSMGYRHKDDEGGSPHEEGDEQLLKVIQDDIQNSQHCRAILSGTGGGAEAPPPIFLFIYLVGLSY